MQSRCTERQFCLPALFLSLSLSSYTLSTAKHSVHNFNTLWPTHFTLHKLINYVKTQISEYIFGVRKINYKRAIVVPCKGEKLKEYRRSVNMKQIWKINQQQRVKKYLSAISLCVVVERDMIKLIKWEPASAKKNKIKTDPDAWRTEQYEQTFLTFRYKNRAICESEERKWIIFFYTSFFWKK